MLFRLITWIFVIVVLYRLFSRYIMPIFRITSMAGDRLRQMQEQMQNQDKGRQNPAGAKVKKEGDYIDYEEVRS